MILYKVLSVHKSSMLPSSPLSLLSPVCSQNKLSHRQNHLILTAYCFFSQALCVCGGVACLQPASQTPVLFALSPPQRHSGSDEQLARRSDPGISSKKAGQEALPVTIILQSAVSGPPLAVSFTKQLQEKHRHNRSDTLIWPRRLGA